MASNHVIVKSSEAKVPQRRVLTVHERQSLEFAQGIYGYGQVTGENYSNGAMGASPTSVPWLTVKRPRLNEQQATVLKILREQSPEPTNPDTRDALMRRKKEIEELQEKSGLRQTGRELRAHSHRDPDFMSALKKARDQDKAMEVLGGRTFKDLEEERRNICRTLDPDNPESDSEEALRKPK